MGEIVHCEWCGNLFIGSDSVPNACKYCGGPKSEPKPKKYEWTQFYKDWFVVATHDPASCTFRFRFYAGEKLKGQLNISHEELENNVGVGADCMPYIEKRLNEHGIYIDNAPYKAHQEAPRKVSFIHRVLGLAK